MSVNRRCSVIIKKLPCVAAVDSPLRIACFQRKMSFKEARKTLEKKGLQLAGPRHLVALANYMPENRPTRVYAWTPCLVSGSGIVLTFLAAHDAAWDLDNEHLELRFSLNRGDHFVAIDTASGQ